MNPAITDAEIACLRDLSRVAAELGLPIVAVGAMARQLVFDGPRGLTPHRSTTDWDFGVRVDGWESFGRFKDALVTPGSFAPTLVAHKLTHLQGVNIDLVPFGGLAADGRIRWPESGHAMNVSGFAEAYALSVEVELGDALAIRAATTPHQVALKLVAFAERRDGTDRDLSDLLHFLRHYDHGESGGRAFEEPFLSRLAMEENFDYAGNLGPLLLGYDVACACQHTTILQVAQAAELLLDPYSKYISQLIPRSTGARDEQTERRRACDRFAWLLRGIDLARSTMLPNPPD